MTPFELAEPRSLHEAIDLLDPDDASVRPIAGGTALMLMMKAGVFRPTRLVSLRAVEKVTGITAGPNGLKIGAMTPLSALEYSAEVRREAPVIPRTLRSLSNVRVRNIATVGGHLAHADPHMDLPPVLIALDARVKVVGAAGEREILVEELFTGYFETVLARNELITELLVPQHAGGRAAYLKVTTRSADDWPALGVAVSLLHDGSVLRDARIAVSAVAEKPARLTNVESLLRNAPVTDALLLQAGEAAMAQAIVIDDARGSAAYKRELVRVYVARALRTALEQGTVH